MADWPARGQEAPDFWDLEVKDYIDEADDLARDAGNLTSGTVDDARLPAGLARDSEVATAIATAIDDLVDSAPGTLDTLKELADALGDDPNFATTITNALTAIKSGRTILPAPTGVTATDDAALAAAITAAGSQGIIIGAVGTYQISSHHVIPNGVDLWCQGGGSTSKTGTTIFKCMASGAQIEIAGGGGISGNFEIDGNSTATTPFKRSGGTGANGRTFVGLQVRNNAAASIANDLALFYGAQNDLWMQCGWAGADRDLRVFDQGYGGAYFLRCEVAGAGRYHDRYDNQVAGGPYPSPSDIKHVGGILENTTGISMVKVNAGGLIAYNDNPLYSINGCSGPMVDVSGDASTVVSFNNPYFQNTPSTLVAGSIAIRANSPASVVVTGRATYLNFESAEVVNGALAFIYDKSAAFYFNTTNPQAASGGGTVNQIMSLSQGPSLVIAQTATSTYAIITQNQARTVQRFGIRSDGRIEWFPGTNFVHDFQIARRGVGIVGVEANTQQIWVVGQGTTAQRPAAAAAMAGGIYVNTTTSTFDYCDGTSWHQAAEITQTITNGDTTHSPSADAVFDALALKEDLANKATDFSVINHTKYPTVQAVNTAITAAVTGLYDDRGNYDASVNTFPASGGSGTAGAVLKGDIWTVSVAGTLGGTAVEIGDLVRAVIDTPGQVAGNWSIIQNNIGYVTENSANKSNDGTMAADSSTLYPTQHAAKTYTDTGLATKQAADQDLTDFAALTPSNDDIPQRKAGAWVNRTLAQLWADLKDLTVTLTNKTIALGSNTVSGTTAQFNTALTDNDFATLAGTETLTNKRITRRVSTTADTATLTIDSDSYDGAKVTALAQAMTIAAPTGTPTAMQSLIIRIKDNGTARALTWNAAFRVIGVALPTTTVISKTTYVGCIWNSDDSKWDVLAVAQEA